MSRLGFWALAAWGLVFSAAGAAICGGAGPLVGYTPAAQGAIALLGGASLVLVLHAAEARVGRLVTVAAWFTLTTLLLLTGASTWIFVLCQVALVWLARALYLHDGLLAAGADLALQALAVCAAIAAGRHSGSTFLALWSYFLVAALAAFIPSPAAGAAAASPATGDAFDAALRSAEGALRRMSRQP